MSIIKSAARNALPATTFGLPGERKYPMPDAGHARVAESRASEMYNKGALSAGQKAQIDAKARRKLGK